MAKLILLLAVACFQFSLQEKVLEKFNGEVLSDETAPRISEPESYVDDWIRYNEDKKDKKWPKEIQIILQGSDVDYDDEFEEPLELISEIENWIQKSNPEKGKLIWLQDLKEFFENLNNNDWDLEYRNYSDYIKKSNNNKTDLKERVSHNLHSFMLYQMKYKNKRNFKVRPTKRFSSV